MLGFRRLSAVCLAATGKGRRGVCSAANMRLVQFCRLDGSGVRIGVEKSEGQGVIDLKAFDPTMPTTMREFLEMGEKGMECAQR